MKMRDAMEEPANFEAWARLLICRKVPVEYQELVNPDVVRDGAEILKRGEAFEVHVSETTKGTREPSAAGEGQKNKQVFVSPFPSFGRQ